MFNNEEWDTQNDILVTTMDLNHKPYEVIGLVYFQVSNRGVFSNQLSKLMKKYEPAFQALKEQGLAGQTQRVWDFTQTELEKAFFVSQEELKERARTLGADAVIGVKEDTDILSNGIDFSMQMYGTAVRFI